MKRKTMFIVMIVLFFVLIFGIAQAWGNLSIGGTASYYSPKFGEINSRYLGNLTDAWGSPMGLELREWAFAYFLLSLTSLWKSRNTAVET